MSPDVSPFKVRLATLVDRSEWLRMQTLLWPDEDPEQMRHEADRILADPLKPVFVVERPGGGLGGFLEAGTRNYVDGCESSPVGYIEGWFVDADLRGVGAGRALVAAAEDWARRLGLREMGSDTNLENDASIRAHLALGYRDHEHLVHFTKKL